MESFEEQGVWWDPNGGEPQGGTLSFSQKEGALLTLARASSLELISKPGPAVPIMHGSTPGSAFTLIDVQDFGTTFSTSGVAVSRLVPKYVIRGEHLEETPVMIRELTTEYRHGLRWSGFDGLTVDSSNSNLRVDMRYCEPDPVRLEIAAGLTLEIRSSLTTNLSRTADGSFKAREHALYALQPANLEPLDELIDVAHALADFLTFTCLHRAEPDSMRIRLQSQGRGPDSLKLYLATRYPEERAAQLSDREVLVALDDIQPAAAAIISRWLEIATELRPVRSDYLAALYSPQEYVDTQFMNIVRAVEVYHRRLGTRQRLVPAEIFGEIRTQLESSIPQEMDEDLRESIRSRLRYANEPTLRARLQDLVGENLAILSTFFRNLEGDVGEIVKLRNYYTHFGTSGKVEYRPRALARCRDVLLTVLELSLLATLGVSEAERVAFAERSATYRLRSRNCELNSE